MSSYIASALGKSPLSAIQSAKNALRENWPQRKRTNICPRLSNYFCTLRTNGQLKAGVSKLEMPAHFIYTYAREDYLLSDRLNRLPE